MKIATQLLVIDPQNDFCDVPDAYRPVDPLTGAALAPALPVAGAHADMLRTAQFISTAGAWLDEITRSNPRKSSDSIAAGNNGKKFR